MLGDTYRPGNFISGALPELPNMTFSGDRLSGNGPPEGVVPANPGQTYIDLPTLNLWQKQAGTQKVGWRLVGVVVTAGGGGGGGGAQQIYTFPGNPNGNVLVNTTSPCMCIDTVNQIVWRKTDGVISNTGWY